MARLKIWKYDCKIPLNGETLEERKARIKRLLLEGLAKDMIRYFEDEVEVWEDDDAELTHARVKDFTVLNGKQTEQVEVVLSTLDQTNPTLAANLRELLFFNVPDGFLQVPVVK